MENILNTPLAPSGDKPEPAPVPEAASAAEVPEAAADKPVRHVRQPLLRRRGNVLLMGLSAICGAVCGMVMIFGGIDFTALSAALPAGSEGSFLTLFLGRFVYGGIFLLAEYILGYFALGEWLVWAVPLCCGMGSSLTLAVSEGGWKLLPAAAITMALSVFGANASGEMSSLLLELAAGKNGVITTSGSAARDYTLHFLAYLAVLSLAAFYEAGIKLI